ncbi:unnamed protein product [Lasius platythorax]|uniref:Uncharacterized protein n=1 Tax=Lasius platythorax TaxID=488582 RepID=A0AAV2NX09_9HYME
MKITVGYRQGISRPRTIESTVNNRKTATELSGTSTESGLGRGRRIRQSGLCEGLAIANADDELHAEGFCPTTPRETTTRRPQPLDSLRGFLPEEAAKSF